MTSFACWIHLAHVASSAYLFLPDDMMTFTPQAGTCCSCAMVIEALTGSSR
jgi:hypothetical protein